MKTLAQLCCRRLRRPDHAGPGCLSSRSAGTEYGGKGYAYILREIVPKLRALGVTEQQVTAMLVDTPKRIFAV